MLLFNSSQACIKGFLFLFPFYKGLIFVLLFCTFLGACSSKSDSDSSNTNSSNTGPSNKEPSNTGSSNASSSNSGNKIIAAGAAHTCVILNNGSVKCLGKNDSGETEGGTPDLGGKTATHIAAGLHHTCAILNDGNVKCWGINTSGQIGGGVKNVKRTRLLSGTRGSPLSGQIATHIAAGGYHTCVILSNGSIKGWGNAGYSQIGRRLSNLGGKTAIHITAGTSHTCAILNDNSVKCWGRDKSGQIGGGVRDITRTLSGTAGNPLNGKTATHIAAGNRHTCAILNDGSVKCWGRNDFGSTGGGVQNNKNNRALSGTAGNPISGKTATHIAAGIDHTCAILDDDGDITNGGPVKCWGDNSYGQTGGGTKRSDDTRTLSGTAGNPLSGKTATRIRSGSNHTCAILSDNSMKCWGDNRFGQTDGGTPISLD